MRGFLGIFLFVFTCQILWPVSPAYAQAIYNKKPVPEGAFIYTPKKKAPAEQPDSTGETISESADETLGQSEERPAVASSQTEPTSPEIWARVITSSCVNGNWESAPCLDYNVQLVTSLLQGYEQILQAQGQAEKISSLQEHCAASTVTADALDGGVPAYAYRSAFKECMEYISDVTNKTGIQPDLSLYQLLGAAVMCLPPATEDVCQAIEAQLSEKFSG